VNADARRWLAGGVIASARRIFATAAHAWLLAVRARVFACVAGALLLVVLGLPQVVRGDGSLAGDVRIILDYALGFSTILLGTFLLWVSCGAISREVEEGQIRLLVVKPIHAVELWLGRWLGLTALSAVLLAIAGLGTWGILQAKLHTGPVSPQERQQVQERLLTAQRQLLPRAPDLQAAAANRLQLLIDQGVLNQGLSREAVEAVVHRQVRAEDAGVAPGRSKEWRIELPADMPAGAVANLRVHMRPGSVARWLPATRWTLSREGGGDAWSGNLADYREGVGYLPVPPTLIQPGGVLCVRVFNAPDGDRGTVVFDVERGVELLAAGGGFGPNLLRALCVVWCRIALLCAVGVAAGTLFSFPVAMFAGSVLVLLTLTGHYFITTATMTLPFAAAVSASPRSLLQSISEGLIRALETVAAPAVATSPIRLLSDGLLISWSAVGGAVLMLVVVYGGVLALLSAWILRRRELALPAR
jgi:hypothetical protein